MCNVGASLDLYSGTLINMSSIAIKGAGGGVKKLAKVEIELSIVSNRGECQVPDAFLLDQKILLLTMVPNRISKS